jgi:hypothetical protein
MTALNWRTSAPWSRGRVESFETAKSTVQMAKLRSSFICVCVCTQCTAARLPPPLVYQFEKKKKKKEEKAADESDFQS